MRGQSNLGQSPSTISDFGKFAVERYLVFGTSFKGILKGMIFPWDSRQEWDYAGNDEKVIISTKERL